MSLSNRIIESIESNDPVAAVDRAGRLVRGIYSEASESVRFGVGQNLSRFFQHINESGHSKKVRFRNAKDRDEYVSAVADLAVKNTSAKKDGSSSASIIAHSEDSLEVLLDMAKALKGVVVESRGKTIRITGASAPIRVSASSKSGPVGASVVCKFNESLSPVAIATMDSPAMAELASKSPRFRKAVELALCEAYGVSDRRPVVSAIGHKDGKVLFSCDHRMVKPLMESRAFREVYERNIYATICETATKIPTEIIFEDNTKAVVGPTAAAMIRSLFNSLSPDQRSKMVQEVSRSRSSMERIASYASKAGTIKSEGN